MLNHCACEGSVNASQNTMMPSDLSKNQCRNTVLDGKPTRRTDTRMVFLVSRGTGRRLNMTQALSGEFLDEQRPATGGEF